MPEGAAGSAALAAHDAAGLILRPLVDADGQESTEEPGEGGNVRRYSRFSIRGFILAATDQRDGWPSPTIEPTPDLERPEGRARTRRWQ